ncbi:MAG: PilZ domain-containing protein [Acidobacteriota bacterium]
METGADMFVNTLETVPDFFNRRAEPRVKLPILLYLRPYINRPSPWREAYTENVSRQGARVWCEFPLEIGTLIEIFGFDGRFRAIACVCDSRRNREGGWLLGVKFLKKTGEWVIH